MSLLCVYFNNQNVLFYWYTFYTNVKLSKNKIKKAIKYYIIGFEFLTAIKHHTCTHYVEVC